MGRAARAKQGKRIKLEKVDYFELMAHLRLLEVTRHEAQAEAVRIAEEHVKRRVSEVGKKGAALMERLAAKYGFDTKTGPGFRFEDATCELIPLENVST
jgi:hypothetical protein